MAIKSGVQPWHIMQSRRLLMVTLVVSIAITLDRVTKHWALNHLACGEPSSFLPGFLQFTLTSNTGAAFSLGSQNGFGMGALATVLTLVLSFWIFKRVFSSLPLPVVEQIGMGCLLGGAIGNLIDRYTQGRVTDFLEFMFVSFPVFNMADVLIDVGLGLIAIGMIVSSHKPKGTDSGGLD